MKLGRLLDHNDSGDMALVGIAIDEVELDQIVARTPDVVVKAWRGIWISIGLQLFAVGVEQRHVDVVAVAVAAGCKPVGATLNKMDPSIAELAVVAHDAEICRNNLVPLL